MDGWIDRYVSIRVEIERKKDGWIDRMIVVDR